MKPNRKDGPRSNEAVPNAKQKSTTINGSSRGNPKGYRQGKNAYQPTTKQQQVAEVVGQAPKSLLESLTEVAVSTLANKLLEAIVSPKLPVETIDNKEPAKAQPKKARTKGTQKLKQKREDKPKNKHTEPVLGEVALAIQLLESNIRKKFKGESPFAFVQKRCLEVLLNKATNKNFLSSLLSAHPDYLRCVAIAKSYSLAGNELYKVVESYEGEFEPNVYDVVDHFYNWSACALYTKMDHTQVISTKADDTYKKFIEQEHHNLVQNNKDDRSYIYNLASIINEKVTAYAYEVLRHGNLRKHFSNGASHNVPRKDASVYVKLTKGLYTCNSDIGQVERDLFTSLPGVRLLSAEIKQNCGAGLHMVSKNAFVDRVIMILNALDIYMLKEPEYAIRLALKRFFGIDITTQQDLHKLRMLEWDSIGCKYATLDLVNGSQSVYNKMRIDFTDQEYYNYTKPYIEDHYIHPKNGCAIKMQHELSMGSPLAFVEETSIFASIALASCLAHDNYTAFKVVQLTASDILDLFNKYGLSVFGDDIMAYRQYGEIVSNGLEACGLRINHEKTFIYRPAVESCGTDVVFGIEVRPVFFRHMEYKNEKHIDFVYAYYNLCNFVLRFSRATFGTVLPNRLKELWNKLHACIPEQLRCYCNEGDQSLLTYEGFPLEQKYLRIMGISNHGQREISDDFAALCGILEGDSTLKIINLPTTWSQAKSRFKYREVEVFDQGNGYVGYFDKFICADEKTIVKWSNVGGDTLIHRILPA